MRKVKARVTAFSDIETTKNGFPCRNYTFSVTEETDYYSVGDNIYFLDVKSNHPKSAEYFVKNARAVGMTNNDILNPEGIGNVVVELVLELNSYKDETYWNVKYINSLNAKSGSSRKKLDEDSMEDLAAELADLLEETPVEPVTDKNKVEDPF